MNIEVRKVFLSKLDDRVHAQEKNVKGLIEYAKKITGDLEVYKEKVELSEKIVEDLHKSGNESVNSLLGMLRMYKRQAKNAEEEIDKLKKLNLIKEDEIVGLNEEIASLTDYRGNFHDKGQAEIEKAKRMIEENLAVIKR